MLHGLTLDSMFDHSGAVIDRHRAPPSGVTEGYFALAALDDDNEHNM